MRQSPLARFAATAGVAILLIAGAVIPGRQAAQAAGDIVTKRPALMQHWLMVQQDLPTASFWDVNYDARVGRDPEDSQTDRFRSYFQFDLAPFAGKQIKKAVVTFTEKWRYSCTPEPVYLWRTGSITKGMTWFNAPALTGTALGSAMTPKDTTSCNTFGTAEFDVKSLMAQAAAERWPNVTFALASDEQYGRNGGKAFDSRENKPFIDVEYNSLPDAPVQLGTSGTTGCSATADAYVNTVNPEFKLRLVDADAGQQLRATVEWRPYGGATSSTRETTYGEPGMERSVVVPSGSSLAHGQRYEWRARAYNEYLGGVTDVGPWSPWCVFTVDAIAPVGTPSVTADPGPGWLEDRPVNVSFAAGANPDVYEFLYLHNAASSIRVPATNGAATVQIVPSGRENTLTVSMLDRAGNPSAVPAVYRFDAAPLPNTAGNWNMDDAFGDVAWDSSDAGHYAMLVGGYEFDPDGAANMALHLDGGADSRGYTEGPVLNTNASFTVLAWLRLDDKADRRTALSQAGVNHTGFTLRYDPDCDCWAFTMRAADTDAAADVAARSNTAAQTSVWTHLAGVYDHDAQQLRIYVNGRLAGTTPHRSTWNAQGPFGFGYANWYGFTPSRWSGDLDEVKVYQFAASERKISQELPHDQWGPRATWKLDEGTGTVATDTLNQGHNATLTQGASWITPGRKDGAALHLDGAAGHAYTAGPVVRTDASFTVGAWVRLERDDGWFAVASQDGKYDSAFSLKYSVYPRGWAFEVNPDDLAGANPRPPVAAISNMRAQLGVWTHLAGVYDHAAGQLRLYVNGVLVGTAAYRSDHGADGAFQIGRGRNDGFPVWWWPGDVDEVRVVDEALSAASIKVSMSSTDQRAAQGRWDFDESSGPALDSTPSNGNTAVLIGGATRAAGKRGNGLHLTGDPDGTGPAVGAHAYAAGPIVRTDGTFTAAAWVKLDNLDRTAVAVSQDGEWDSGFSLRYDGGTRQWAFVMSVADGAGTDPVVAVRSTATVKAGAWTHLAGIYDAAKGELRLYVNVVIAGTTAYRGAWNATRSLQFGRGRTDGMESDWWLGDIDEVRLISTAMAGEQVRALLTSAPFGPGGWWRLDDGTDRTDFTDGRGGSGVIAVDDSGNGRVLALGGVTTWLPVGPCGGALDMDGWSGRAVSPEPVLSTARGFTIAAWVRLNDNRYVAAPATAVSQDGSASSVFQLGYTTTGNTWSATLGSTTVIAPSSIQARVGFWTHLAAVYDDSARRMALFVNGQQVAAATVPATLPAAGKLRLGQGQQNSAAVNKWYGAIDEIRALQRVATAAEVQQMTGCDGVAPPPLPMPGPILIRSANSSLCVIENSLFNDVIQSDMCYERVSEMTLFEPKPDGTYQIGTVHFELGARCLGVENGSTAVGAVLYNEICQYGRGQSWRLEPVDTPLRGYRLRAVHSGLCADVQGTMAHTQVKQATCDSTAKGQVFLIETEAIFQSPEFADHVDVNIPDLATIERPMAVAGLTGGGSGQVTVEVVLRHDCASRLLVSLVAPSGATYYLSDTSDDNACIPDETDVSFVTTSPSQINGPWKLRVQDPVAKSGSGYLDAWSLTFGGVTF
jgi:subtilisin-like proprotein convertase family protein